MKRSAICRCITILVLAAAGCSSESQPAASDDKGAAAENPAAENLNTKAAPDSKVVLGSLPKEAIQEVVDQQKHQIRACYEKELQQNETLAGRILVRWTIGGDGAVTKASIRETTMNNATVEQCVVEHVKTWKFPEPAGGGIVEVNYPFVLQAG